MGINDIPEQIREMKGAVAAHVRNGLPDRQTIRTPAELELWSNVVSNAIRTESTNIALTLADDLVGEMRVRIEAGERQARAIGAELSNRHLYMFAIGSEPSGPVAEVVCRPLTEEERTALDAFFAKMG